MFWMFGGTDNTRRGEDDDGTFYCSAFSLLRVCRHIWREQLSVPLGILRSWCYHYVRLHRPSSLIRVLRIDS